jgi:hypothetical protein
VAPTLDTLTVTDSAAGAAAVDVNSTSETDLMVTTDTATLEWSTTGVGSATLESAVEPSGGDCGAVAASDWAAVSGFTFSGPSGQFSLTGLTGSACFRFGFVDSSGNAVVSRVFATIRQVAFTSLTVDGNLVSSNRVVAATGYPLPVTWSAVGAQDYTVDYLVTGNFLNCSILRAWVSDNASQYGGPYVSPATSLSIPSQPHDPVCFRIGAVGPLSPTTQGTVYYYFALVH